MSRSYRKPYKIDSSPYEKRQANRRIRKTDDIANGNHYRKLTDPYDICDYRWYDKDNKKLERK